VEDFTADDNAKVIAQAVRKENKFASKALLSKVGKTSTKVNLLASRPRTISKSSLIEVTPGISLLTATLYQGSHDRNVKLWNITSTDRYILH
jgi:hypothetical protein